MFPRKRIVILPAYTTICSTLIIDCTKLGGGGGAFSLLFFTGAFFWGGEFLNTQTSGFLKQKIIF